MPPLYDYFCPSCRAIVEIIKSMDNADRDEIHSCGAEMSRYFNAPWLSTSNCIIEPQKNWAFGKTFTTKNQLKEEIARYKGETGRRLEEVGNDNLSTVKKKFKEY